MFPEFTKYGSLSLIRENRPEEIQKYIDLTQGHRFALTEKIHGSNMSVTTDGEGVKFARRNTYLEKGESFYGYEYIAEVMVPKMLTMFKDMKEMIMEQHRVCDMIEGEGQPCNRPDIPRDFQTITIRGEFAGGHYPADGVPQCKVGHGQVGKGKIWYSQDKSFYAFEMLVDGEPVDFYTLGAMCGSYGIPMVPVIMFGTFEECLAYSREHLEDDSLVASMQPLLDEDAKPIVDANGLYEGLPRIEGNQREGHTFIATTPFTLPNGKAAIFKHKGAKFLEDNGSNHRPSRKKPIVSVMNAAQVDVFNAVLPNLTVNRMEAVMSKEGECAPKDFPRVMGLVVQDALEDATDWDMGDLPSDVHTKWTNLTTKERKQLTGQLNREACERLRSAYFG